MKIISVEGIVVGMTSYKESSKILNIFTKEYGIIGCYSKGCKSLKSKLRLISERFAYGNFELSYKENGLSTLIDGDIINYFTNIVCHMILLTFTIITQVYKNVSMVVTKKEKKFFHFFSKVLLIGLQMRVNFICRQVRKVAVGFGKVL